MEFLLRAERSAEDKVAEAERAAQNMLEVARQQARSVAARADARIAALSVQASESVRRAIDVMRRDFETRGTARRRPLGETSHVETAVQRAVDWLLGDGGAPNREADR